MIGCLQGRILALYAPVVLLDVAGVGYEVETPLTTFCELQKDTQVFLWTHLVVREDAQLLYGFLQQNERDVFRRLIKLNGVGAKLALAILSNMNTQTLAQTVKDRQVSALINIPGIGKKTAERLIVELTDKLTDFADVGASGGKQPVLQHTSEAKSALLSLGYSTKEADKALDAVQLDGTDTQQLIRLALKWLSA